MSKKYILLTCKGICMNFLLELNFFILSHPVTSKTASQNRPDTYGFRRAFITHAEMLITHAIGQCLDKFSVSNGQQKHN